ncbi:MAG: hypothetical protein IJ396_02970 [Oscillibacter sp.]|nr:hypothetical protein [Oscillibacter sp.]
MKWKTKLAAVVLAVLMLVQTVPPTGAKAAKSVYFTAINDNIMPLTDATMPFWSGGFLYISGSVFTGYLRESIGVSYTYNSSKQIAALYAVGKSNKSLVFDLATGQTQDRLGTLYANRPAIKRGSEVFVPAALVAEYFDLTYSVIGVEGGHLVRLRTPKESPLNDAMFADAASYTMQDRYEDYLKNQAQSQLPNAPEGGEVFAGKRIYLNFRAAEPLHVTGLLDILDRQRSQGAFFCTEEFLRTEGGLLRRMTAMGQSVGICVDGSLETPLLDQVVQGNVALYRATCGMTRLIWAENAEPQALEELTLAGYVCLQPGMDYKNQGLLSSGNASALLQKISSQRGDISVWLGENVSSVGLNAFLTAAYQAEDACVALVETVA